jgi:demethylmenaquinone methyltransferase/2-methoxy-6-polyprenyl-1,4-benzoquinol methylase
MKELEKENALLSQQIEYYRARAAEYDEWFFRRGRYDRGDSHRRQWFSELENVKKALASAHPGGNVLELACGTGLWTGQLLDQSERIVAIDASSESLEINRKRIGDKRVEYVRADLFSWFPNGPFDLVFFAFWLSHVPLTRFDGFWENVRNALGESGTVFFIDSLMTQESTAINHDALNRSGCSVRKLNDGREFEIVKIFHSIPQLEKDLIERGWYGEIHTSGEFFYYGVFHRKANSTS